MVKIHNLEIENIKRIKAVSLTPTANGLTIIGGKNGQGKTSVLDSIAWALGGEKYRPSDAQREGSVLPPRLKITLSNGLVVERKGKNAALTVTDPTGKKGGQQLLGEFVEQLALDLPKFLNAASREKAAILLRIIGIGDKLADLELKEKVACQERLAIGRIASQKEKFAKELPSFDGVPETPVSASELIARQQAILAKNGENQLKRQKVSQLEEEAGKLQAEIDRLQGQLTKALADLGVARKSAAFLQDESTEQLEADLRNIEEINAKVRANLDKEKAEEDAKAYQAQYDGCTAQIEALRREKAALLEGADLPLPGLSVEDGELTYKGRRWDCMSSAEQLRAGTAIVRKLNPECGFVLLDKLEQMDLDTLEEFGGWLEAEGLQAIATRVSTGEECSIIIEDGQAEPGPIRTQGSDKTLCERPGNDIGTDSPQGTNQAEPNTQNPVLRGRETLPQFLSDTLKQGGGEAESTKNGSAGSSIKKWKVGEF